MPANNGKSSLVAKLAVVIVALVAVAAVAFFASRGTAVVTAVTRGRAYNAVPGSVVVYADGHVRELRSELGGKVAWCEPLQAGRSFNRGDVLLKLDTTDLDREIEHLQNQMRTAERRLALLYAHVPEWQEAKARLQAAIEAQRDGKGSEAEVQRAQAALDTVAIQNNPTWISHKESLEQTERLYKNGTASEEQLDRAKRALANVETQLRIGEFDQRNARSEQERHLRNRTLERERMTLMATFDGVVKESYVWEGALIGGGATVATIYANDRIVVAKVSEEDISGVKVGQFAQVRLLSYPSEEFEAKVSKILPTADESTQRYTVFLDVQIDPKRLIPYSTGEVLITVGTRDDRPLIPRRALFNDNHVFVVKGGQLERRQVKLGYVSLTMAEVVEGLVPGERVVVEELDRFRDGDHVRVQEVK